MNNVNLARQQAELIATALDGESVAMPSIGHVEQDENPIRMLAVALDHAYGAIAALTDEVRALRDEVDRLSGDRLAIDSVNLEPWRRNAPHPI